MTVLVASELGGLRMRKKIMMMGTSTDVFAAWFVSFTSPYIMNEPGNIGGKIGYIWVSRPLDKVGVGRG